MVNDSQAPQKIPRASKNCSRCRNHDVTILLKGHKRYCRYSDCQCKKCLDTVERQKKMADQTARRRADAQDKQYYASLQEPTSASPLPPDRPCTPNPSPAAKEHQEPLHPAPALLSSSDAWPIISQLISKYSLPLYASACLHIILTRINKDPEVAYKIYKEGTRSIFRVIVFEHFKLLKI